MQPAFHRRKLPASLHPAAAPTTERAVAEHPRPPAATLEPAGSQPYPAKRPVPPAVNCQREALPGARPGMAPAQRERAQAWAKEQRAQRRESRQRHHRPPSKSSAHRLPPGHPAGQLPQARRALGLLGNRRLSRSRGWRRGRLSDRLSAIRAEGRAFRDFVAAVRAKHRLSSPYLLFSSTPRIHGAHRHPYVRSSYEITAFVSSLSDAASISQSPSELRVYVTS